MIEGRSREEGRQGTVRKCTIVGEHPPDFEEKMTPGNFFYVEFENWKRNL
jgi:hypothetical protein